MKGPALLLTHSLKRVRTLVLAVGLLLAVFQVILIVIARSIQSSGGFAQLAAMIPPFAREMMGPALASFMSFAGNVCLGYFHPVVMSSLVALSIALATTPALEVETGFIDLILARPLARHWIITRTVVVVVLATAVLLALMVLGTWLGLQTLAPHGVVWPSASMIAALVKNLGFLMLSWSGVAMAIGAGARRRGVAGAIAGLLALATFLLDYAGRLWSPAEKIAWISPFRYYTPFDLVMGNALPVKNLIVLAGIAVAGFAAAYVVFARRDIAH